MKRLLTAYALLIALTSAAQQYNFNEIEVWSGSLPGSPKYFTELNNTVYFQGQNNYNKELWKSDGTQTGTELVADLNGGASSSPSSLKAYNGMLIFTAGESATGTELWKSDGTAAGTVLLQDIRPGSSSGFPATTSVFNGDRETFLEFNGNVFFFGNTGNGIELWKTDGTSAGTTSVRNFTQGPVYGNGKYNLVGEQENLGVIYNGELYFFVEKSSPVPTQYRGELWKTDGTTSGTVQVKDSLASTVHEMIVCNNKIYFVNDDVNGEELWSSDGTDAGTILEADINPGTASSFPTDLTVFNGALFFSAFGSEGDELFMDDGTGATMLKDVFPGMGSVSPNSGLNLARFVEYNSELYFLANDGSTGGSDELWKTDGTEIGTVKVLTLAQAGGFIELLRPRVYDNKLFYLTSSQLWVTDGSSAGTLQLTNNGNPNEPISQLGFSENVLQGLWFAGANTNNGQEVWYFGTQTPTQISVSSCQSYTVPSGDETYTISGIYSDTIPNAMGGDSLLTIQVEINQPTSAVITENTCHSYTSPSGNYIWNMSGTYLDTIVNASGCDSVVTIQLNVNSSSALLSETACDAYTSPSRNYTWTSSGTYFDTITNSLGCDSLLTIQVTIQTVDTSVTNNNGVLEAVSSTGTYQWLDCENNFSIISGETAQSYTPTAISGSYAVIITEAQCSDTSSCFTIDMNDLADVKLAEIKVFPNPSGGSIFVELKHAEGLLTLHNTLGQRLFTIPVSTTKLKLDLPATPGCYLLEYRSVIGSEFIPIVRK